MLNKLFVVFLTLTIASCTTAQTASPKFSKAELHREQEIQAGMAKGGNTGTKAEKNVPIEKRHVERVQPIVKTVAKAGRQYCYDLGRNPKTCKFNIVLLKDGPENAFADGGKIYITPAIIDATENDDELAFILAHETAHNIMSHVASSKQNVAIGSIVGNLADQLLQSKGYSSGNQLGKVGAQMGQLRYSQGFEKEADYVGLYILARTGYDLNKAPNYWRRASMKNQQAIYTGVTHPSNSERFISMSKTIDEIAAKKAAGQPLSPSIQKKSKSKMFGL
jgi:predicted Zn-dependent protease